MIARSGILKIGSNATAPGAVVPRHLVPDLSGLATLFTETASEPGLIGPWS
jgi:hypothetical protein